MTKLTIIIHQITDNSDMIMNLLSDSQPDTVGSVYNSNKCIFSNMYSSCDRSILSDIDPDINYYNNTIISEYYNESTFNNRFTEKTNLSMFHLNIRSVPLHFTELLSYLDVLHI